MEGRLGEIMKKFGYEENFTDDNPLMRQFDLFITATSSVFTFVVTFDFQGIKAYSTTYYKRGELVEGSRYAVPDWSALMKEKKWGDIKAQIDTLPELLKLYDDYYKLRDRFKNFDY